MIIEKRTVEGAYNFDCTQAIIDTEKHGRLLVVEGFGGQDGPEGGCYRWKHGLVAKLRAADTFEALNQDWNECTSTIAAVLGGHDQSRPLLWDWSGHAISSLVESQGL